MPDETDDGGDAEVDQALQPFWDLLLAKVTLFSETWSQRIKEVMRSLTYPKGHHHKCPDHHHHSYRAGDDTNEDESSEPFLSSDPKPGAVEQDHAEEQQDNSQDE